MDRKPHSMEDLLMELLIENGPEAMLAVFTAAYNMGMKVERERFIGAEHYERAEGRRAFANGYKPKRVDTCAGTATLSVPKTAGHGDTPFYPKRAQRYVDEFTGRLNNRDRNTIDHMAALARGMRDRHLPYQLLIADNGRRSHARATRAIKTLLD